MSEISDESEIEEYLETWLDQMMEVYGQVLDEWESFNVVQPRDGAEISFGCNNCGKCCEFVDHWVWVYPSDLVKWFLEYENEKIIPLFLGILFPVEDRDGMIGYGLPSQKTIWGKFNQIINTKGQSKVIKHTLRMILAQIKKLNRSFSEDSDYCIFYNKDIEEHCMIYKFRPIQCITYPYDFAQFTKIVIPPELQNKYGAYDEDLNDLPLCPKETYSGSPQAGILTNEEQRDWVTEEKSNYLASILTQKLQESDISDMLLELYHQDILDLDRQFIFKKSDAQNQKSGTNPKKHKPKRFMEAKRPEKPKPKPKRKK